MNRRTFIGTSIAASLAAAAEPAWAADATHKIDRVGLQLYTVRSAMKTDFEGSIAKVAATGYKEVEFAGIFAADAATSAVHRKTFALFSIRIAWPLLPA